MCYAAVEVITGVARRKWRIGSNTCIVVRRVETQVVVEKSYQNCIDHLHYVANLHPPRWVLLRCASLAPHLNCRGHEGAGGEGEWRRTRGRSDN